MSHVGAALMSLVSNSIYTAHYRN